MRTRAQWICHLWEELRRWQKTAQQVERDLTAKLGAEYFQKPQVTVYVKEYDSQTVTIEGCDSEARRISD